MVPQGTADRFECPNVFKLIMSALRRSTANIPSTCSHASHKYMYPTAIRGIVYSLCTGDLAPSPTITTSHLHHREHRLSPFVCYLAIHFFVQTTALFLLTSNTYVVEQCVPRTYIVSFLQRVWCIGHTCRPSVWRDYSTPPSSLHIYP